MRIASSDWINKYLFVYRNTLAAIMLQCQHSINSKLLSKNRQFCGASNCYFLTTSTYSSDTSKILVIKTDQIDQLGLLYTHNM